MKKVIPAILVSFAVVALILSFSRLESRPSQDEPQEMQQMDFPEDVSSILQTSCFDCHSSESSNIKAKGKLNFSKWEDMSDAKKVGKLEKMSEVLGEDKMPPKRYLEKNPSAAISKEHKETILKWTSDETNKLMGEGN